VFEESIHMSFGTGIHEAIQTYLKILYTVGEKEAEEIDLFPIFKKTFEGEIARKKIKHTPEDFSEFLEDGQEILSEFKNPANRLRYFPTDKWEWVGIEVAINESVVNNCTLTCRLDMVLKDKVTGDIRIIDFKTATRKWTAATKEDFAKISQLLMYKAAYSKKFNIPLNKIHIEFIILSRKIYPNVKFEQNRIQIFKPASFQNDVMQVIKEFRNFVETCFTPDGNYNLNQKFPKVPGKNKKNCKYCNYLKNGKCDGKPDPL